MLHRGRGLSPRTGFLSLAVLVAPVSLPAQSPSPRPAIVAIEDVSVVPMDRERLLDHQTVVIRGDRIESVGPAAKANVPGGALRVDGRGKFLMPGLVDMHLHAVPGSGEKTDLAGQQLRLLIANGITTARSLGGPATALTVRDRVAKGELIGPRLYIAGSSLNGRSVTSAEQGKQMVIDQKAAGFDLLKTHGGIARDIYDTIVATAKQQGLVLSGHVTPDVGLEHAMASHQQIEHLDGYIGAMVRDGAPVPPPPHQFPLDETLDYIDAAKMRAIVRATVDQHIWNTPTLGLFRLVVSDQSADELAKRPEMKYLPEKVAAQWKERRAGSPFAQVPAERRRQFVTLRDSLVRALHASGAKLLAGSDSPQEFLVSGFSLHEELEALALAGLKPYAVLETATRNPAEFMGTASEVGTVAAGKRADLLLLDANPLADVRNTRRVAGVMAAGRWLDRGAVAELLVW
jgi:imidazolonepropionase-like amidohydrolase